jgi:hypothetical protein
MNQGLRSSAPGLSPGGKSPRRKGRPSGNAAASFMGKTYSVLVTRGGKVFAAALPL